MLRKSVITLYSEPCDCDSHIRHNNGGNYHAIHQLHLIQDGNGNNLCTILEETSTREDFPGDEFEVLTYKNGQFALEQDSKEDIVYLEIKIEPIFSENPVKITRQVFFRQGEAKIIWQNPE